MQIESLTRQNLLRIIAIFMCPALFIYGCEKNDPEPKIDPPTATLNAALNNEVNISYAVDIEEAESAQLDVLKNGEIILSKTISPPGGNGVLSYQDNPDITKGNYEFIAKIEGKNGEIITKTASVEIPNYDPVADWEELDINFEEDSGKTVTLSVPTDKNPEDNPVSYIPESLSGGEKVSLEFNHGTNVLKINGFENTFGNYTLSAEFGNSESGTNSVAKEGTIYELLRLSGVVESNETHQRIKSTVIPYEINRNDTTRLFSTTSDTEGKNITDNSGYFAFKLNKRVMDVEHILLMARQGTPGSYEGWVRVKDVSEEDFNNVLIRAVPYAPYADRKEEFKRFVGDGDTFEGRLFTRFDIDGSVLVGLPGYENYQGLEKIRILDSDPFTEGTFTREEQENFKQKLLDEQNINGILGDYNGYITPEMIVFGNDLNSGDYSLDEEKEEIVSNNGSIIVVPRENLPAAGKTYSGKLGTHLSRGTIYLKSEEYNETTFLHEIGHLFSRFGHTEYLYGESIMTPNGISGVNSPGPADRKKGHIIYEKNYLTDVEGYVFDKNIDYLNNILREDFK